MSLPCRPTRSDLQLREKELFYVLPSQELDALQMFDGGNRRRSTNRPLLCQISAPQAFRRHPAKNVRRRELGSIATVNIRRESDYSGSLGAKCVLRRKYVLQLRYIGLHAGRQRLDEQPLHLARDVRSDLRAHRRRGA